MALPQGVQPPLHGARQVDLPGCALRQNEEASCKPKYIRSHKIGALVKNSLPNLHAPQRRVDSNTNAVRGLERGAQALSLGLFQDTLTLAAEQLSARVDPPTGPAGIEPATPGFGAHS